MHQGKADFADVDALTELRLDYLMEDNGSLEDNSYRSVGFEDDRTKYHLMKWKVQREA